MSKVHNQTLLDEMVRQLSLPRSQIKQAAEEILELVREGLRRDGVVNISNFGTFRLKPVAERRGVNPQTREVLIIPAHHRVMFSPCKALRELIQPSAPSTVPLPPDTTGPSKAEQCEDDPEARQVEIIDLQPSVPLTAGINPQDEQVTPAQPSPCDSGHTPEPGITRPTQAPPHEAAGLHSKTGEAEVAQEGRRTRSGHTVTPGDIQAHQQETVASAKGETNEPAPATRQWRFNKRHATLALIVLVCAGLYLEYEPGLQSEQRVPSRTVAKADFPLAGTSTQERSTVTGEESRTAVRNELHSQTDKDSPPIETGSHPQSSADSPTKAKRPNQAESIGVGKSSYAPVKRPRVEAYPSPSADLDITHSSFPFFKEQRHEIQLGENLWRLAELYYQDPLIWPYIFHANKKRISNPDRLNTGQHIIIPTLEGSPAKLTRTDRHNIAEGYYLIYRYYKENGHQDAFFALLEAKRYDPEVVNKYRKSLQLGQAELVMLKQQPTTPF